MSKPYVCGYCRAELDRAEFAEHHASRHGVTAVAPPLRHQLKTWPEFFQAIWEGRKPFEYRLNDRDFQVGDVLWLREFVPPPPDEEMGAMFTTFPVQGHYTGREMQRVVTYILEAQEIGPQRSAGQPGFVIMGTADGEQRPAGFGPSWERLRAALQQIENTTVPLDPVEGRSIACNLVLLAAMALDSDYRERALERATKG